jgi:hypothetical protein
VSFEYVFLAAFAAVVLFFAWRFFRTGSLTGALLGGSIEIEFGEIPLRGGAFYSQKLKVYGMKSPGGERFVGVSIVSKAPLAASMAPFKLTSTQARELAGLLTRAAEPHGAA